MSFLVQIAAQEVQVDGVLLRSARPAAAIYEWVREPQAIVDALRTGPARVDLFTFMQTLPDTPPKYAYPMEWNNVAALSISTFENWWANDLNTNARKALCVAQQSGIVVREVT